MIAASGTAPYIEYVGQRVRVEVEREATDEDERVVMRLVAIARDEDDVAGRDETLETILFAVDVPFVRSTCGERRTHEQRAAALASAGHAAGAASRGRHRWRTSRRGTGSSP